jgi:hypothetical protein
MKKIGMILALLLVLGVMSSFAQEVQSGTFSANSTTPNYTLHQQSGDRAVSIEVTFDKGFEVKPEIILSVSLLDAEKTTNIRYSVLAKAISRDGFVITIRTWSDSKIYGIGGSWLAVSHGK